jgi:hypothetical protein
MILLLSVILRESMLDQVPLFAKELLTGGFAKTVVAPLEHVKILFQVDGFLSFHPYYCKDFFFTSFLQKLIKRVALDVSIEE